MTEESKQNQTESANNSYPIGESQDELRFHYIKGAYFRTIHVDGAHGGATPQGKVQMSVFSERFPIPQTTVTVLTSTGPGDEIREKRISKEGIIREVEANLIFDRHIAKIIGKWLIDKADEMELIEKKEFEKSQHKAEGSNK